MAENKKYFSTRWLGGGGLVVGIELSILALRPVRCGGIDSK